MSYGNPSKKIVVTIEARMGSERLPGKVLLPLAGRSALSHLVDRIRRSRLADSIVVASSINPADLAIENECRRVGCEIFRGEEFDIPARLLGAADQEGADVVVQITGDCPLIDPEHLDRTVKLLVDSDSDFASTSLTQTLPLGFDVRAFTIEALRKSIEMMDDPVDKAHGSYFISRNPENFDVVGWQATGEMAFPEARVTVDTPEDYELLRLIYDALYPENQEFSALDVVRLLRQNPDWLRINADVRQKHPDEK